MKAREKIMVKPELGKWYNVWEDGLPTPDKKNPKAKCNGYTRSKEVLVLDDKGDKYSAYFINDHKDEEISWETLKGKFLSFDRIDHWMPLPVDPPPLRWFFDEKIAGVEVEIKYKDGSFRCMTDTGMTFVAYKEGVDFYEQAEKVVSRIRNRLEKKETTKKKTKKKKARPRNAKK